jgi:hypothetical protein
MNTRPANAPARCGMNEYTVYVGEIARRAGSLAGTGRYPPLSRPAAPRREPISVHAVASEFFEDS